MKYITGKTSGVRSGDWKDAVTDNGNVVIAICPNPDFAKIICVALNHIPTTIETAVEFGFKCHEQGDNLQNAIHKARSLSTGQ